MHRELREESGKRWNASYPIPPPPANRARGGPIRLQQSYSFRTPVAAGSCITFADLLPLHSAGPGESLRPTNRLGADECSWSGHELVPGHKVPQRPVDRLGDANAGCDSNASGTVAVIANPQTARRSEIATVIARPSDAKSLAQPAGTAGQFAQIGGPQTTRGRHLNPACPRHLLDPGQRLDGAEEHAARLALRLTGNVQAVVIAVDEVDVGVSGRPKQHGVARGKSGGGMRSRIFFPQIGFDLNDAGCEARAGIVPHQHLAQKLTRHPPRRPREKRTTQWVNIRQYSQRKRCTHTPAILSQGSEERKIRRGRPEGRISRTGLPEQVLTPQLFAVRHSSAYIPVGDFTFIHCPGVSFRGGDYAAHRVLSCFPIGWTYFLGSAALGHQHLCRRRPEPCRAQRKRWDSLRRRSNRSGWKRLHFQRVGRQLDFRSCGRQRISSSGSQHL